MLYSSYTHNLHGQWHKSACAFPSANYAACYVACLQLPRFTPEFLRSLQGGGYWPCRGVAVGLLLAWLLASMCEVASEGQFSDISCPLQSTLLYNAMRRNVVTSQSASGLPHSADRQLLQAPSECHTDMASLITAAPFVGTESTQAD